MFIINQQITVPLHFQCSEMLMGHQKYQPKSRHFAVKSILFIYISNNKVVDIDGMDKAFAAFCQVLCQCLLSTMATVSCAAWSHGPFVLILHPVLTCKDRLVPP